MILSSFDISKATARGFLVVLALSIHDFFEGIALGVCKRATSVWFLLLAFASHKWVISGTLGMNWARSPVCSHSQGYYMINICCASGESSSHNAVHDSVLWHLSCRGGGGYGS